jgi:putative peptidoglycan lipid II flippase
MSLLARHMARSSLVVMLAFVAAKVVGLLRERAIAHSFGASAEYDAYLAAFKIPDLLFTLVAGGALVSAFLPVFADGLARGDRRGAWRVASGVTNLVFASTVVLASAAAVAAPWLVAHVVAPGFSVEQQALTVSLMRVILLATVVFSVSGIQMGILNAFQHFLTPAIAPILYNLGILAGALFLAPRLGIMGLAYGVVLGSVLHLLVKVPSLVRHGFTYVPGVWLGDRGVRQVLWLMWPRVLSMGTVQAVFVVTTRLASSLPAGSLSALSYAWVLAQMPQTILGTAVGTVAFPTLAEQSALGQRDELRRTAVGAIRLLLLVSLPASVALWTLGGAGIAVLLQTGRFGQSAAEATTAALRMYALGLTGHVLLEVVARVFYAQKDTLTPLYVATMAMALNIALALALVEPVGYAGLALANSIAVSVEVVVALAILARRGGGFGGRELATVLAKGAVAAAAMAAAISVTLALVPAPGGMGAALTGLVELSVGGLAGAAVYALVTRALGIDDLSRAARLLVSSLRR